MDLHGLLLVVDVHTVLHLHLVWDLHKGYLDLHTVLD